MEDNDAMNMGDTPGELNTATITKFLSTEQCLSMVNEPSSESRSQRVGLNAEGSLQVGALGIKSYVVETNSKATIRVMNRSLVNRIAHEKEVQVAARRRKSIKYELPRDGSGGGGKNLSYNKVAPHDVASVGRDDSSISADIRQRKMARLLEESKRQKEQEVLARQRALYSSDSYFSTTPFFAAG